LSRGPDSHTDCQLGVLAFGDSITNGGGELQWGVALQSWALWVARGLGVPFTSYATDGARAHDVITEQIPAFNARSAVPEARYHVGCLYIGVNDVRVPEWNAAEFERDFRAALGFVNPRCERVLTVITPLDLGRPRSGPKVVELNEIVVRAATAAGALTIDLGGLRARNLVMPDHVHLTAFGQITLAERALDVLERDGLPAAVRPRDLVFYETTRKRRLQGDATYLYRHAKVTGMALWGGVRERLAATG
jgi:lysophospholipase L1-like esterase